MDFLNFFVIFFYITSNFMSTFPENLHCALHFLVFLAIFTCCKSTGKNKPLPDFLTGAWIRISGQNVDHCPDRDLDRDQQKFHGDRQKVDRDWQKFNRDGQKSDQVRQKIDKKNRQKIDRDRQKIDRDRQKIDWDWQKIDLDLIHLLKNIFS